MILARVFTAAAGCVVLGAAVASCSGSFGSGTGLPNAAASPNFGGSPAPTPPTQSSVIVTYGESTAFQSLTEVGGYSGAIAFPKAPEPTAPPSPKGKPGKNASPEAAPTPVAISIGATLSIVKPQDGPDINFVSGKGKRKRSRELPARALAYITLLPTHDATLESYPRIALDIPREIASQYRDGEFGLALWNSGEKDSKYRLAVAELDTVSTPPPVKTVAAVASANPSPGTTVIKTMSPLATSTPRPQGASPSPGAVSSNLPGVPGGVPVPSAAPTLPPARIVFGGTAATLKLVANRPAVFALYALPHPSTTPVPKASSAPSSSSSHAPAAASSSSPAPGAASASPAPSSKPTR
jgi:hypothetical protein